jgi:NAD+ kinase
VGVQKDLRGRPWAPFRPVLSWTATPGGKRGEAVFRTIGLIGKRADERVVETLELLVEHLRTLRVQVLLDADSARDLSGLGVEPASRDALGTRCDLVIVVGGDGTFLGAARSLVEHEVRLLGINLGRIGFLADITADEMIERLGDVLAGRFSEERRSLLHAVTVRGGERLVEADALNDVVVHKWNVARLIRFETYVDGRFLNRQRSDGLIVATPTGSTAYALSGGGPILDPTLDATVLVPICPHTLSNRPLVVDGASQIEVVMAHDGDAEAQLTCDGQTLLALAPGDRLLVQKKAKAVRLLHPPGHDHFATLRAKLHWGKEL